MRGDGVCRSVLSGSLMAALVGTAAVAGASGPARWTDGLPRVVTVSADGGEFDTIAEAMAAVDAPAVIKLGPGVYTERVEMVPRIDIEGSGVGVTVIRAGGAATLTGAEVVDLADRAELRDLTVENIGGGGDYAVGLYAGGAIEPRVRRVAVHVTGSSIYQYGLRSSVDANPDLQWVTLESASSTGTNRGAYIWNADATLRHVDVLASGGAVANYGLHIVDSSLPVTSDVRVIVNGATGSSTRGLYIDGASPRLEGVDVEVTAEPATTVYGGFFEGAGSAAHLVDCSLTATGDIAYGLHLENVGARIEESRIEAAGAFSVALYTLDPSRAGNVTVMRSHLVGGDHAIQDSGGTASFKLAWTQIEGGIDGSLCPSFHQLFDDQFGGFTCGN